MRRHLFHRHSWGVILAVCFLFLLSLSGWSQVVTTNLPPLSGSIGVWGDLDNDGLVDVLLAGTVQGVTNIPDGRFTRIYHNAGAGTFYDTGVALPQLDNAAAAWGDFDNDGDLDLLISGLADGTNGAVSVTEIYRNDGSNHFTSLNAGLEPLSQGSVAWVDYDNDGWQDVFVTGLQTATTNWVLRLYHNNGNGTFTLAITNFPTPQNARGYWADSDNDGYVDLLLAGTDATYLFKNNGAGGLTNASVGIPFSHHVISPWCDFEGDGDLDFMTSISPLPPVISPLDYHPSLSRNDGNGAFSSVFNSSLDMWLFSANWGDIDNSGRACVVVAGWVPLVPGGGVWGSATKVYIYLGSSWQEVFTLGGWDNLPETWVDYDGDGALDIFTTGGGQTTFWKNTVALHRDFPQPPLNPTNTFTALDAVTLSWQTPSNTPATGRGLSYNVRVGHTPGSSDVVSPLADAATGRRLIQTLGNAGAAHVFKLNNVPPGNYFWSVQSIGQSYTGSPFTAEGMFTVTSSPPVIVTQPTNLTVLSDSNAVFAVAVIGTKPLAYQWRKDGVPLSDNAIFSGSTSLTLTISNAQPNLAGAYDLVITNTYGSVTSAVVALVVHGEPRILSQPVSQYPLPTRTAAFTVSAAGTAPLIFQWYFNGTPLADNAHLIGTATSVLSVQNAGTNDVGSYSVIISNAWGSITSAVVTLNLASQRFVNLNNPSPSSPYTNWATAATVIQDAVDVSGPGDDIVVTNGTYATGGRAVYSNLVNRVAVDRPVTLRSVNGPSLTIIQGVVGPATSAVRCVYLTNGSTLNGFTLKSGGTRSAGDYFQLQCGGGVLCASVGAVITNCIFNGCHAWGYGGGAYSGTLNNCTLTGNSALYGGGVMNGVLNRCQLSGNSAADPAGAATGNGGGVYQCSLTNCTITGNSSRVFGGGSAFGTLVNCLINGNSSHYGGGADAGTLINCTVVNNSAPYDGLQGGYGGGVYGSTVVNSIVVQNSAGWGGVHNNASFSSVSFSCTPNPGGVGNITADPAFVNSVAGNYHLQSSSPCVNAGNNDPVIVGDLDGLPRVVDGVVDMGVYEHQHAPFILISPVSQSVLLFSNVLFTVSAIGDDPLSYQWQKDGVNLTNDTRISGAFTASLSISNLVIQDAAGYRVVVSNASDTVTSAVATLTLLGLPIISTQPVSRTVPAGTNVSFSVTASGLAALSYQWRFNQSGLLGKTNSSLSLTNVQSANVGDYDVVITNIYGALTSSIATLTVLPSVPTISTQAVSRVVSVGQNVSFTVAAKGSEPMTCQWLFNGTNLPGANSFTLTFTNVNSSFSGTYRAAVSNAVGGTFSTNVTLVVSPVLIWGQTNNGQLLASAAIPASVTNVIAITAAGSTDAGLPCLALRADGSIAPWGYSSRDPAPPTNAVDVVAMSINSSGGSANNLVLLADGTVVNWNSSAAKPPVPATITNQNIVAIAAGGLHQLALRGDGTILAWGVNTSGQTNVPASATNVIAIAAGASHSLALRADGTVVGWGLNTSGQATALSNAVNVVAISAGGNQSLALLADGSVVGRSVTNNTQGLLYGPPPANATNMIAIAAGLSHNLGLRADRTVTGWGQTNSGQLNIPNIATNVLAIAAGGGDSLALVRDPFAPPMPPRIGRPPLGRALKTGDNVVLNALAVGGFPLRFQWLRDGAMLLGQTNQWLALTGAHPRDAGNYQLVAMNDFGSATSAVAAVSVSIPQPVLKFPARGTNGFSFTFDSINGVIYVSEFKNALVPGPWTELERRFGGGGIEVVTDTNPDGVARFYRVWAVFAPSPKLASLGSTGGAVNFNFNTVAVAVYVVQYKEQLADPIWLELSRQTGTGAPIVVTDLNPPGPSRFYRVKVE